jgi:hypothetical protein
MRLVRWRKVAGNPALLRPFYDKQVTLWTMRKVCVPAGLPAQPDFPVSFLLAYELGLRLPRFCDAPFPAFSGRYVVAQPTGAGPGLSP